MITTPDSLAERLGIPRETLAIAMQTEGVKHYLRRFIIAEGEMRVLARGPDGKGIVRSVDVFETVFGEPLHPKRKRRAAL